MKKIVLITFVSGVILLIMYMRYNSLQGHLSQWGISLSINNFKLISSTRESQGSLQKDQLEAQKEGIFVKITRFKAQNPQKLIDDKIFQLSSLFEPTTSPYPEALTNVISCPEEFKPKQEDVKNGQIFTLFAGERFGFGVCSEDLVKYQAIYAIFDCGKKGVFEISLFGKERKSLEPIMKSFQC